MKFKRIEIEDVQKGKVHGKLYLEDSPLVKDFTAMFSGDSSEPYGVSIDSFITLDGANLLNQISAFDKLHTAADIACAIDAKIEKDWLDRDMFPQGAGKDFLPSEKEDAGFTMEPCLTQ